MRINIRTELPAAVTIGTAKLANDMESILDTVWRMERAAGPVEPLPRLSDAWWTLLMANTKS
jgi:hypothetical protein